MGFDPLAQRLACRRGPTLPGVGDGRAISPLAVWLSLVAEAASAAHNQHPFTVASAARSGERQVIAAGPKAKPLARPFQPREEAVAMQPGQPTAEAVGRVVLAPVKSVRCAKW